MKKNIFLLIILWLTGSSVAFAQFEFMTMPAALLKGANAIIREEQQEFEVQSIGKAVERHHVVITILNESGNRHAQFGSAYSKLSKIRSMEATLYNAFGKAVRKAKMSDFSDVSLSDYGGSFFDDSRLKSIDLSYTEYPYTIEYESEILRDGLLFYPDWEPQSYADIAVEESVFEVTMPAGQELRYHAINFPKEPNIKTTDKKSYRWEAKHLPAYEREPYTPKTRTPAARIITAPFAFEIEGYTGDMSTWKNFGQFISQLNAETHQLPPASVTKFKNLVADCPDETCKIQRLYAYLQANTRYVGIQLGIGGWRPMKAAEVEEYKYGDCKALSNYFCAMLEAVGIQGYYTLIGAGEHYSLRSDFPSNQFNHVVVCVPQAKDTTWVECTSQTSALGYCGTFTGNREALLITPQGGKLVRTPKYDMNDNLQIRRITLTINPEGIAEANIWTHYTGIQQEEASYLAEMPEQKRRDLLYEAIGLKNFEILEHTYARQKDRLPSVNEQLKMRLPAYIGKSGKRLFVQPNVLSQWRRIPPADSLRQSEIQFFSYPFIDQDTVEMQLPAGYGVEHLPEAVEVKSAFGEYSASCTQQGDTVLYVRRLHLNADIHPKEKYAELTDFCKKINKADARKLVLVKQEP